MGYSAMFPPRESGHNRLERAMKLHLTDFWHHGADHSPADRSTLPGMDVPPSRLETVLYAAILILGIPVVVGATMFVVQHLYDGLLWLLPS